MTIGVTVLWIILGLIGTGLMLDDLVVYSWRFYIMGVVAAVFGGPGWMALAIITYIQIRRSEGPRWHA